LVAGDDRRALHLEITLDDVKVGSADTARVDLDQDFVCGWLRDRHIGQT
jgi:hypothetical protein